jgi:hypothetical protein
MDNGGSVFRACPRNRQASSGVASATRGRLLLLRLYATRQATHYKVIRVTLSRELRAERWLKTGKRCRRNIERNAV